MRRFLFGICLSSLLMSGCHWGASSPEPTLSLPPATATGANTVGFELDGSPWTTYGRICTFSAPCHDNTLQASGGYRNRGIRTLFLATRLTLAQRDEEFLLQLDSIGGPGVYACSPGFTGLGSPIPTGFGLRKMQVADPAQQQLHSVAASSRIVLTRVDTVQRIIAGTFEGQLSPNGAAAMVVTVRQGHFDVHY
jgi:hypothetical protein